MVQVEVLIEELYPLADKKSTTGLDKICSVHNNISMRESQASKEIVERLVDAALNYPDEARTLRQSAASTDVWGTLQCACLVVLAKELSEAREQIENLCHRVGLLEDDLLVLFERTSD